MKIARVFPRRTRATPEDNLVFTDSPQPTQPEIDAVHISVAFTWDIPRAEILARDWERIAPVSIGGPAMGSRGKDFNPGLYLKPGCVITSRGCPNRCWFCSVWRREGSTVRELPIVDGWNIFDDNLLACSEKHVRAVFAMLKRQDKRAQFTGGLEAARLRPYHVDLLRDLRPEQFFFAYDTPDDLDPLRVAGKMLTEAGWSHKSHIRRCYVLIGYPRDTFEAAEKRMFEAVDAGFFPMGMLWRDKDGETTLEWRRFQRKWARPAIINAMIKERR